MQIILGFFLVLSSFAHGLKSTITGKSSKNGNTKSIVDGDGLLHRNIILDGGRSLAIRRNKRLQLQDMRGFEALTDSFLGGTVGVMSVAFILELRKVADERLDGCPYCMGNGEILCGSCFGTGAEPACACRLCSGRGLIQCINCKGDGRITPILLQSKAVRDPDYATDNIGSGINGA